MAALKEAAGQRGDSELSTDVHSVVDIQDAAALAPIFATAAPDEGSPPLRVGSR